MLPIKNSGMEEEGFYKLKIDNNFDEKMIKLRKEGLIQIKSPREQTKGICTFVCSLNS